MTIVGDQCRADDARCRSRDVFNGDGGADTLALPSPIPKYRCI